ncbi:MAG TPA: Nramp family divalent metal transporter [Solirubrobacterales bacterium]|jgi:manganese transport protein|nr:Nramp family divalent metal transporter [Solirubrobacterales bacterium]
MKTAAEAPPPSPEAATSTVDDVLPGEALVADAARRSLDGRRRGLRRLWPFLGPAFVASVAYIDPGNFATNIASGAQFGYMLLWVVLAANLIGMVVQTQSAKLGIATGKNLPELCRQEFPRKTSFGLWIQAELVAMATDIAEVIGAALGLYLLFGIPLFWAGLIAGAASFAILALQQRGVRKLEAVIVGFVGVVVAAFVFEVAHSNPDPKGIAEGMLIPGFDGTESVLLATGILGATVMPHVVYLHSALTQSRVIGRNSEERKRILNFEKVDVVIAMTIAGLINMSMVIVAAGLFNAGGLTGIDSIEGAYAGLQQTVSDNAATIFGVALLASGLASTSVGTMAGQVVMQGFIRRRIPLTLRRLITLLPALVVLAVGIDPTRALVVSQVVLSFGIPFALIPLLVIARRREVMGDLVNPGWVTAFASVLAAMIIALNLFLLQQLFFG